MTQLLELATAQQILRASASTTACAATRHWFWRTAAFLTRNTERPRNGRPKVQKVGRLTIQGHVCPNEQSQAVNDGQTCNSSTMLAATNVCRSTVLEKGTAHSPRSKAMGLKHAFAEKHEWLAPFQWLSVSTRGCSK